ncbi:BapA prefix-like domain-containing protein [Acinetobacter bereziniae]|uniref:BapA/Bap/LapF family prefix-like domain-containing protein n=1 Tax=Acinetobacter bereziniae TaxID=106648 RepID=UPI001D18F966|nr:BapA prefix-like domain-containing protein [Acinetobacter bereziniae]UUN92851.1 BapA prefix-like domain-containing protein [Acinetobacter bereziniae]WMW73917.1 BapA prefix-like domain-containing protein [Acinetobacter bereziniae]
MANFVVIEKDSLSKSTVDTNHITLSEASIIHTKMNRDDVAEYIRDGDHLLLKLKNGEVIVIENFFVVHQEVTSDLVFEDEDGCILYWFDGVSGFKEITGLEALLPEASSHLTGMLPWLIGTGVVGGVIAATHDNDKNKENIPNGKNSVEVKTDGSIIGKTENIPEGTKVVITITGQDKNGNTLSKDIEVTVQPDGSYTAEVPEEFVDGDLTVSSEVVDRNGNTVQAEDQLGKNATDDPNTPEDESAGLDRVDSNIDIHIDNTGKITGTTTDVAPNSDVVITITGKDAAGKDVVIHKTVKTDADGNYQTELTVADGIVDGSSVTVEATTTDRNGQGVGPASDHLAGQGDNDNDPSTPDDTGLDLVTAEITVEINTAGKITGTTTDVAPNSDVVITIIGKDAAGKDVVIHKTVKTDADGNYQTELTVADGIVDGSAVNVEATTTDRNGQGVGPASDHLAGQGDNDNDPSTPDDTGLDLVTAEITVEINTAGKITGTTKDVAPNSDVVITIIGKDAAGKDVVIHKTVKTDADGNYQTELTVADGIVDGSAVNVEATTTDLNGQGVGPASDHLAGQGDNDPNTPDDTGLDLVTAEITVEINTAGKITGTTTDVAPNSDVVISITGKDAAGKDVVIHKTVKTDADGNYQTELTVADGIVDGSAVNVEATTTDRNGQGVGPATDHLAGQGDNDNDPSTPDDTGLDLVTAEITVEINTAGKITGTTKDVAPNSDVVITITGKDAAGKDVVIHKTVKTDADGNYQTELTVADGIVDGSAVNVEATTTDRNGQGVGPASDHLAGQGDNDNDPSTPDDTGLDLVTAEITVEINTAGKITGTTTDVAPNSDVVITITGKDAAGKDVVIHKTVKTDADGNYQTELTVADGIVDGSSVTVEATTTDRNGQGVGPASDHLAGQGDNDNDPSTPDDTGLDLVTAEITVEINTAGKITGTTTDVAPNSDVVITIIGKDAAGKDVVIHKTVKTDADGNYQTELTVADGIVDGSAVNVEATTTDRNGQGVGPASDHLAGQGDNDNDPSTPDDTGLDLVTAEITVEINTAGKITGTTKDVAPNSDVVITIIGKDAAGKDVVIHKTVKTDADGNYQTELTVADGIVDGSAVNVEATTTDLNGQGVGPASDHLAGQGDNDPNTPDDTGLDLVTAEITVEINTAGKITGTTTDVAPNSDVVISITGKDAAGKDVVIHKTVKTDADGNYQTELTVADGIVDGSAVNVEATTTDRNGQGVGPATDHLAGQGDNDNDPSTPDDTGLDLVTAEITVEINTAGKITGTTKDVAPNSDVVITITGKDAAGKDVVIHKTVKTDADGNYQTELTVADGIVDGSAVNVEATTTDRNGQGVGPASDHLAGQGDNDNDPSTPDDTGLDLVTAEITVEINTAGKITGTTTDVAPNSDVVITITGYDENGEQVKIDRTVQTDSNGHYVYELTPADGIATGTQGSTVDVVAKTNDRNGNTIQDHDIETVDPVIKNDQSTGVTNGDNSIIGTSGDDLIAGDTGGLKTNFVAGKNYNVSIVLDLSGSMLFNMAGTIRNGANVPEGETRLEIAKKGLKAFIQQMVDHDGTINLQIASFSANNGLGNTVNKIYTNVSVDNIDQIFADIGTGKNDGLQAGGGTYPELGFNKAVNWFNDVSDANFENQTYYITDGEPNSSQNTLDSAFRPLADQSKVFAVGVSSAVSDATVSRYDNTDANGNKLPSAWSGSNHGEAKAIADADKLIAYLIGGSENFVPADVGSDTIKGGAGDDILFGDAMNTNWITWSGRDPLMHPQYSGYSTLIAYLKAEVTSGAEPTQQQIYDFVKENYKKFVEADANDPATKGGNDTIYGGAGDDIIIAGAGNDIIYGGSGNDIISTGRGNDTIMYDVLINADATGGNGTDVWVDYQSNDKIEFSSDFFDGLLSDKSNIGEFIKIEDDGRGNAVLKVDRDGSLNTQHEWADILIIEGKSKIDLMDMINQQIVIG